MLFKKIFPNTPAATVTVVVFIAGVLLYALYFTHQGKMQFYRLPEIYYFQNKNLTVLVWTPFFGDFSYIPEDLRGLGCSQKSCVFTNNRSNLKSSDAILIHWRDIKSTDLPPVNNDNTKLVLYNYESPPHTSWHALQPLISRINFVATYRSDSDITAPYGFFRHRRSSDVDPINITFKDFQRKEGFVNVVSNCNTPSKREILLGELRKFLSVKVFGKCGSRRECQGISYEQCYEKLAKSFRFYLSFENSLCADYATEKVFLPLAHGMVPVVFGGANYSRILPPNSFINSLDFRTTKDLAEYLKKVDSNFTLYQSYHHWRKDYVVQSSLSFYWLCDLCRLLHNNTEAKGFTKTKYAFHKWWYDDANCTKYTP